MPRAVHATKTVAQCVHCAQDRLAGSQPPHGTQLQSCGISIIICGINCNEAIAALLQRGAELAIELTWELLLVSLRQRRQKKRSKLWPENHTRWEIRRVPGALHH